MKRNIYCLGWLLVISLLLMAGCVSGRSVERVAADEVIDLSGRWNDTDSRMVAEEMVSDALDRPWLDDFMMAESRKPVVIVGTVRNKSSEHIETAVFIKDIERELINSGKVKFVASKGERAEVREEREDQQSHATEETAKRLAAETGADYIMQGLITTQVDAIEGKKVVAYQVDMELIHLETNEKVWIGSKEIKKYIEQSGVGW